MRKLLFILFTLLSTSLYSQVFTQTFVDRCTNEVKVVTANFTTGSATVAFYSKVRTFTYQEFLQGQLQVWLNETYTWYNALSPCSTVTQQTQQAQQQAQQAQQQAQQAQQAATSASQAASSATQSIPVVPPPTTSTTSNPPPTSGTTGGTTNGTSTQNTTSNTSSSNTTDSTGGTQSSDTGSTSSGEGTTTNDNGGNTEGGSSDGGGTETETKTEETKTEETKTEETKSEEKTEEVKEESKEETKEETKEEEKKEEEKTEEKEEEKEEEKKEEEKKEEEKEEKEKEKKMMPIQLKADMMANQNPLGGYNAVMNIGASQTSIFGDTSYSANLMVWDNLQQVSLMGAYSKVNLNEDYSVKGISAIAVGYSNNYSISTLMLSFSKMKPFKNGLTVGMGISTGSTFESYPIKENLMVSYNVLATKSFQIGTRITYSPAVIWTQTPFMSSRGGVGTGWEHPMGIQLNNDLKGKRIDGMAILANSFTVQLTRRFSFNVGWTAIKSTNNQIPLINAFMIGSKLPF